MIREIAEVDVVSWVERRRAGVARFVVGVCGPPGSGKSTLAARFATELDAIVVPMDGFHLPNDELDRRGRRSVKGAPDTFDAVAFVALVRAIREGVDVTAPVFDRDLDEPVTEGVAVPGDAPLVVIEGNYLLLADEPWAALRELFDVVLYVDADDAVRVERLIARHVRFGRSRAEATEFALRSDEANAARVAAGRHRADAAVTSRLDAFRVADDVDPD